MVVQVNVFLSQRTGKGPALFFEIRREKWRKDGIGGLTRKREIQGHSLTKFSVPGRNCT